MNTHKKNIKGIYYITFAIPVEFQVDAEDVEYDSYFDYNTLEYKEGKTIEEEYSYLTDDVHSKDVNFMKEFISRCGYNITEEYIEEN